MPVQVPVPELRPGDRVMVYAEPRTRHDPEGVSILSAIVARLPDGRERWQVWYEDASDTVEREVWPADRVRHPAG